MAFLLPMLSAVPIPPPCFDPDCDFTITVDSQNRIDEAMGEDNNIIDGRYICP
jgi:hypothetical protein